MPLLRCKKNIGTNIETELAAGKSQKSHDGSHRRAFPLWPTLD